MRRWTACGWARNSTHPSSGNESVMLFHFTATLQNVAYPRTSFTLCFATLPSPQKGYEVLPSACLPAHVSRAPHVQTSRNFPYVLPVAAVRSSSEDGAICYVLPVLLMASRFHTIGRMWRTARLTVEGYQSAGGNAERIGTSVLQLRPSVRCLPPTDNPQP